MAAALELVPKATRSHADYLSFCFCDRRALKRLAHKRVRLRFQSLSRTTGQFLDSCSVYAFDQGLRSGDQRPLDRFVFDRLSTVVTVTPSALLVYTLRTTMLSYTAALLSEGRPTAAG